MNKINKSIYQRFFFWMDNKLIHETDIKINDNQCIVTTRINIDDSNTINNPLCIKNDSINKINNPLSIMNKLDDYKKKNMGNIYIIHEREFLHTESDIYKIGRTTNIYRRNCQYPKNCSICFSRQTENVVIDEKNLINLFKSYFINKTEYGDDYFEGNIDLMIKIINDYLDEQIDYCSLETKL